jgi:hypothetical protein
MIASIMLQLCASMGRKMFGDVWGRKPCLGNVWVVINLAKCLGNVWGAVAVRIAHHAPDHVIYAGTL